jgi:hypothetical protein
VCHTLRYTTFRVFMLAILKRVGVFALVSLLGAWVVGAFLLSASAIASNPHQAIVVHWGAVVLGAVLLASKGKLPTNWSLVVECTAVAAPAAVLIAEALK